MEDGQLTFVATANDTGWRGFQFANGDINGDGYEDVVILGESVSVFGRTNCGAAYIFYGPQNLSSTLDFSLCDVTIFGPASYTYMEGLAVGDFNNDNYDDIVLGTTGDNKVRLILGGPSLASIIDLNSISDCTMLGNSEEYTGSTLASGDVNGDGIKDILIAAPLGDGPDQERVDCGNYYIVYGRTKWPESLDLNNETVIYGAENSDGINEDGAYYPGMQIVSGDLNGDKISDILIGSPGADGPDNGRINCGEAYVVFGSSELPNKIDLATQSDVTCYGVDAYDHVVRLGAGDVNGDGIDDFLIGARDADGSDNSRVDAGEVYVVYGKSSLPATIDLKTNADVTIFGIDPGDILGRMLAKDINGDGISDLFLGAPDAGGPDNLRPNSGEAYLLFGGDLPKKIDLSTYSHHTIYGVDDDDILTGFGTMALGDFDNDLVVDFAMGACWADGENNSYLNAGEAYIVSGRSLTFLAASDTIDLGVIEIISPPTLIDSGSEITPFVSIKNYGTNTELYTATFTIDDFYLQSKTDSIEPGVTDTISFPVWLAQQVGSHTATCNLDVDGDIIPNNNKLSKDISVRQCNPYIEYVKDVPHDQGGKVTIKWIATCQDTNVNTLSFYSIWRAIPENNSSIDLFSKNYIIDKNFTGIAYRQTVNNGNEYYWEWIDNVPAHRFASYTYTAETLYDSMSTTNGIHYFMVSAQTDNPNVFYDSNVDSGYSVDNLKPLPPNNLTGFYSDEGVLLHWKPNKETDLKQYLIYRSDMPGIDIQNQTVYAITQDTVFTDQEPLITSLNYYAVCAQDIHENISDKSNEVSIDITTINDNSLKIPKAYLLSQNRPNPFNPTTTIKYALPKASKVKLEVFNVLGQKVATLVNGRKAAGYHKVTFNGSGLPSGVYYYRLQTDKGFVKTRKLVLLK